MKVLIAYGTTEGQTEHIAAELAERLEARGAETTVVDLEHNAPDLTPYGAIILGGSIHIGKYQREVVDFATRNAAILNEVPSWFFGVSLAEASGDVPEGHPAVQKIIDDFLAKAGWRPRGSVSLAGALKYREYNFIKRAMLKRIAGKAGGDTDTSRDWEYTDWAAVDRLAEEVAGVVVA